MAGLTHCAALRHNKTETKRPPEMMSCRDVAGYEKCTRGVNWIGDGKLQEVKIVGEEMN